MLHEVVVEEAAASDRKRAVDDARRTAGIRRGRNVSWTNDLVVNAPDAKRRSRALTAALSPLVDVAREYFLLDVCGIAGRAQGASCSGSPPRDHHARDAARRDGVRVGLSPAINKTGGRIQRRPREGANDGADLERTPPMADCDFNLVARVIQNGDKAF